MSAITVDTRVLGKKWLDFSPEVKLNLGRFYQKMSDDEFFEFCRENADLRIEMDKRGDIEIMPPTGMETGGKNFILTVKFGIWVEKDGTGKGFDSSAGLILPNGAKRSPDLCWMKLEKWNAVPKEKRRKFAPVVPDFVVEIRSETDSLPKLKNKLEEYIENGVSLGWLIDVKNKQIYIYRPNTEVEVLNNPNEISGEPLLKGFTLNVQEILE